MIQRMTGVQALQGYAPAGPRRASAPSPDEFRPAPAAPGVYTARSEFRASPSEPRSAWKTGLLTAALTATATAGFAALPSVSLAADLHQEQKSPAQLKAEGLKLLASSRPRRVSLEEGLATLRPEAAALIRTLPVEAQQTYVELEPAAKGWLNERIQGTTSAALGIIQINNREAFISGEAVGRDVFQIARQGLDKQVKAGLIPAEIQGRLEGVVDQLARLTPTQRGNLVGALEAELR